MVKNATKTKDRIQRLRQLLKTKKFGLIVIQDNPDPDAIAAALALKKLFNELANIPCSISHGGTVGRAENRALVRYLQLNLRPIDQLNLQDFDAIAMVDTQPGTGNNSLPVCLLPEVVIDHHPIRKITRTVPLIDIRKEYGATSTILCEYLIQANVTPDAPLATALLYGIRSDTQDLGRDASKADITAFQWLYSLANPRMLAEIQRGRVERDYFKLLHQALSNAVVLGPAITTNLGEIKNPDIVGEVADMLLRDDETNWSLAYGVYNGKMLLSLRTSQLALSAEKVVRKLTARIGTGGGHDQFAGGQIPLPQNSPAARKKTESTVLTRLCRALKIKVESPQKLIAPSV